MLESRVRLSCGIGVVIHILGLEDGLETQSNQQMSN